MLIKSLLLLLAFLCFVITTGCSQSSGKSNSGPDHIVIVIEENHGFDQVIGNRNAPYINQLAHEGLLFTNAHAIAHPSQPNYIALFSGSTQGSEK